jgi:hypothetical protein
MCRPSDYPPYEDICSHDGIVDASDCPRAPKMCGHTGWCACTRYRRHDGLPEPLGNQPQDEEARVLHRPHQLDGKDSLAGESRVGGLDPVDVGQVGNPDGYDGDAERYGPFESDSILIFQ